MSKKNLKVHLSSKSDEWGTPLNVFHELSDKFGPFELDVCATDENHLSDYYYTKADDGLSQSWWVSTKNFGAIPYTASYTSFKTAWMNPPYSDLKSWMKKAYEESRKGIRVVCLIPARTDTKCWHEYVMKAEQILFVKGRIKFGDSANSAPFPSAVVVFDPKLSNVPKFDTITFNKMENYKRDFDKLTK
jgi:site-specific DNA-methyltransferase (adenine-specific)